MFIPGWLSEKIENYAENVFQIYKKDFKKVLYFSCLNFLLFLFTNLGIFSTITLFLKRYGINYLPKIYIIYAFLTFITTLLLYIPFGSKFSKKKLLIIISFISIILILVALLLLKLNIKYIYPGFYILALFIWWLFYTQFWSYALEICSVREGKRIFSIIVCAGLTGGILGGIITKYFVNIFHTENLLFLWITGILLIMYFLKKVKSPERKTEEFAVENLNFDSKYIKNSLIKAIKFFYSSKLTKTIAISFLLYGICVYLLDYYFNKIVNLKFTEEDKLTAFYGTYAIFFYSITLTTELFFSNRIIKLIGICSVMILLPACLGLGFLGLSFFFTYTTAIVVKLLRDVIGNSLTESVYPLIYTPIDRNFRSITITFIEGLVIPCGIAFSGLFLIELIVKFTPQQICLMAGGLSLIWLYFTINLRKEYLKTFIENITVKSLTDKNFVQEHYISLNEVKIINSLKKALYDKNEKLNLLAIEILGHTKDKLAIRLLIEYLVKTKLNNTIKAKIIKILGETKNPDTVLTIAQYLDDKDARVRANAVEALGEIGGYEIKDLIEPCLYDPNPRVRTNAGIILWKNSGTEQKEGIKFLKESLNSNDEITRIRTVYALSKIGSIKSKQFLKEALNDPSPRVRFQAIKGLGMLEDREIIKTLIDMLGDKNRIVRRQVSWILRNMKKNLDEIINGLNHHNRLVRERLALILAEKHNPEITNSILNYCKIEIKQIYRDILRINLFLTQKKEIFQLLIDILDKRNQRTLMHVLKTISLLENSEFLSIAIRRLKDPDPRMKDSIIEVIDNLYYGEILKMIFPLIDDRPYSKKIMFITQNFKEYEIISINQVLKELLEKEEETIQIFTIYTIGELKEQDMVPYLSDFTHNPSELIREVTVEALFKIYDLKSKLILKNITKEPSIKVQNIFKKYSYLNA